MDVRRDTPYLCMDEELTCMLSSHRDFSVALITRLKASATQDRYPELRQGRGEDIGLASHRISLALDQYTAVTLSRCGLSDSKCYV